ncbi:HAD family hydrolase [Dactylosporangium vinaceum]|uniref:HAD family hydrolase n=1 Tax=Dactylosporangium vinaceum TaxID=53362 RepID=A0ABV5MKV5_9ACTN|nr:HAD-IA family hydrolase [Dactylosporangium vinaceum]UAB92769.1 HAD family hydrolase [Dactylosporangium vinaceum]
MSAEPVPAGARPPTHTLFDSATTYRITPAESAAPPPPVQAVLFDFVNTLFQMIEAPDWLRLVAADTGRPGALDDPARAAAVVADLATAYQRPDVLAAQVGRDRSMTAHRDAMLAWFAAVPFLHGHEAAAHARMIDAGSWRPYPDTAPVLRALRERGIRAGVVSDIAWDIRVFADRHGLDGLIDAWALSFEAGREKPDPELFRKACADLGTDPRATLMVGDNPARDGGAAAAGLRCYILPAEHRTGDRGLGPVLDLVGPR